MENINYISVSFDDEIPLLEAVGKLKESNEKILDVLTPFPVHGLDRALSMKRSRIPLIGFIFGAFGAIVGFGFQTWVFTINYPLVFGGKPFFSAPSFIPITFECTVLFAALGMVSAMLIKSKLKPDSKFIPFDENITNDKFIILISAEDVESARNRIKLTLSGINIIAIK
ncbi:MAG: hypothetical protein A2X05_17600 [Bacteroidetes bacterium GWE2_41_25]|nr:MAG: hypothetical protein A2X03_14965 [Bacteroidetes bacterium GWA2_40_15]OFX94526.1 MAG: hypothetical protein A2X06_15400 [Bacteroidetes bacterium GWC2_40_22]OFX96575.1 MAG: hypothetical protein A2X05_17600 [Bacteroidetes bacterium GWE2_41_25]OFY59451.1 MAG: hypothetical protein A2X04_06530 [Bacteroidetes bacterium GWF2_41_9]HAM10698.1 DUF3341 domain-containing protein [Bacteroidales bacterium]